jgi:hypothetical protein
LSRADRTSARAPRRSIRPDTAGPASKPTAASAAYTPGHAVGRSCLRWIGSVRIVERTSRETSSEIVLTAILCRRDGVWKRPGSRDRRSGPRSSASCTRSSARRGPRPGPDSSLLPSSPPWSSLSRRAASQAVAVGALLAFVVRVIVIGAGVARLGFLTSVVRTRSPRLSQQDRHHRSRQPAPQTIRSARPVTSRRSNQSFITGVMDSETRSRSRSASPACHHLRFSTMARDPGILIAVVGSTVVSAAPTLPTIRVAVVGRFLSGCRPSLRRSCQARPASSRRPSGSPGRRDRYDVCAHLLAPSGEE